MDTQTKAELFYKRHMEAVKRYQKKNKETLAAKGKIYMKALREDKDKHDKHLEKRRIYYANVVKPKRKAKKEQEEKEQKEKEN
tara:strand:- start:416 stop:664 length:249 start_codon:yes stop_codon:yes gene_type:complete